MFLFYTKYAVICYLKRLMNYLIWTLESAATVCTADTASLAASQQREDSFWILLRNSTYTTLGLLALLASVGIILFAVGFALSKTRFFRRMVLSTVQATHQGYTARTYPDSLVGLQGTAQTPLRPAGKATIGGVYYDVTTLGAYVAPGAAIVVTGVVGTSLTVQAIHQV